VAGNNPGTTRRAFVLRGGATFGAGVAAAATAGAAALPGNQPSAQQQLGLMQDIEAIRGLHAQFIAGVESASNAAALDTHRAYRANARQTQDAVQVSADRRHATALWHVDVQVVTPLVGDCTIAQMARLQGAWADMRWEAGRLSARYEKKRGKWQMINVEYTKA
jgi:hypothetical protein